MKCITGLLYMNTRDVVTYQLFQVEVIMKYHVEVMFMKYVLHELLLTLSVSLFSYVILTS